MNIQNKVYKNGIQLTNTEIKDEFYALELLSNIPEKIVIKRYNETTSEEFVQKRIGGLGHCDCIGGGEFDLLPIDKDTVKQGGKRYMQCRVCKAWSHL